MLTPIEQAHELVVRDFASRDITSESADMRPAPAARNRFSRLVALLLCAVLAPLAAACGHEGTTGAAPLSERPPNDVPLDPPSLLFHVSPTGDVDASPDLEAEAGEAVALVLENESDVPYELRMTDPAGDQVFATEVPAHDRGDSRALPREVGEHLVQVRPADGDGAAQEFVVAVSET